MQLELARWRGAVDPFTQRDERDPESLEFIEQRHEVAKVSPESVQTPSHDDIYPSPLGILHQRIEDRTAFLRAAHPFIDVFARNRPSACVRVSAQLQKLVLAGLIRRAHSCINRRFYHSSATVQANSAPRTRAVWSRA